MVHLAGEARFPGVVARRLAHVRRIGVGDADPSPVDVGLEGRRFRLDRRDEIALEPPAQPEALLSAALAAELPWPSRRARRPGRHRPPAESADTHHAPSVSAFVARVKRPPVAGGPRRFQNCAAARATAPGNSTASDGKISIHSGRYSRPSASICPKVASVQRPGSMYFFPVQPAPPPSREK